MSALPDGQDCQASHCPPSAYTDCEWPRCAAQAVVRATPLYAELAKQLAEAVAALAVAEAERDDLRQALDERNRQHKKLLDGFRYSLGGQFQRLSAVALARMYRDAGYPVRDDLSRLEGK